MDLFHNLQQRAIEAIELIQQQLAEKQETTKQIQEEIVTLRLELANVKTMIKPFKVPRTSTSPDSQVAEVDATTMATDPAQGARKRGRPKKVAQADTNV